MQSKSGFCSQPNLSPDQRQVSWIEERYLQVLKALDYHCYFRPWDEDFVGRPNHLHVVSAGIIGQLYEIGLAQLVVRHADEGLAFHRR